MSTFCENQTGPALVPGKYRLTERTTYLFDRVFGCSVVG